MRIHWLNISLLLSVVLFWSCDKDPELASASDLGYDYTPLTVGSWWEYEVDSIDHNAFTQTVDTFHFYLREELESAFVSADVDSAYRIERYVRQSLTDAWRLQSVWQCGLTHTRFERVEQNVRYVRLAFPVGWNMEWDGNAFNTASDQVYEYDDLEQPYDGQYLSFDTTITVIQMENVNIIEIQEAHEIYAKGVGMVFKHITDLDLQNSSGIEYTQQLIDFEIAD